MCKITQSRAPNVIGYSRIEAELVVRPLLNKNAEKRPLTDASSRTIMCASTCPTPSRRRVRLVSMPMIRPKTTRPARGRRRDCDHEARRGHAAGGAGPSTALDVGPKLQNRRHQEGDPAGALAAANYQNVGTSLGLATSMYEERQKELQQAASQQYKRTGASRAAASARSAA